MTAAPLKILHAVTRDALDGQPWPPTDTTGLWVIARRCDGFTLWRSIQFLNADQIETTS